MHSIVIDPAPEGGDVMSYEEDGVLHHHIRGRLDASYSKRIEIFATGKLDLETTEFEVMVSSPRGPYDLVPFGKFKGIEAAIDALRDAP